MKVCLYDGDMNLIRKDKKKKKKKDEEIQKFDLLGNKKVKTLFFKSKCFIAIWII